MRTRRRASRNRCPCPARTPGTYSADGKRVAYEEVSTVMFPGWIEASGWRHYRGGRTHPIRVMNLADNSVTKLPWTDSNDAYPMWIGNTVYFLSDRTFTTNLFSYNTDTKELKQLTRHDDFDIANASAGPDAVVYEQAGYIHLVDAKTGQSRQLNIDVTGDLPWARAGIKRVAGMIRSASLSPAGVRVAIEARGDIFTVPVEKGDYRNLTRSTAVNDREPGVVAGRHAARLVLRCERRVPAHDRRADGYHQATRDLAAVRRRSTPSSPGRPTASSSRSRTTI